MTAEEYAVDHRRRTLEFLACLTNPGDEQVTYDLRIVSRPDPEVPPRGQIVVALLCRMDGIDDVEGGRRAGELLRFLTASFREHEFELAPADAVEQLLRPFPITHVIALTRRCGMEALDTLRAPERQRWSPGFLSPAPSATPAVPLTAATVFHVFPFIPPATFFDTLFRLLLLEHAPVAISCRMRPTALSEAEARFLEAQIAACERHAQVSLGSASGDLSALAPTLREQARMLEHYQVRTLFGLKDNAALVTVEIASSVPPSWGVTEALGSLLTEPAGGGARHAEAGPFRYLSGGYQVVDLGGRRDAAEAFMRLDLVLAPPGQAPCESERLLYLFDSVEAAAALRFPPASHSAPPGLEVRQWRTPPAPRDLPADGLLIGVRVEHDATQPIRLGRDDRRRHIYAVGQTGTGKTTLLKGMILDDIERGEGVCVLDPHGDLYRELLGRIPERRMADVVLLDPTDTDYPIGLNLLEHETESQRYFIVQELVGIITRLVEDEFGARAVGEFLGPVFLQHMRMNLLLVMSRPSDPGTLLEFHGVFRNRDYWKRWLPLEASDPQLTRWVEEVLPRIDYLRPGSDGYSMGEYLSSKFEGFVFDPMLRNIFGQKRSTVNLRATMDQGRILLVNLAKGELTEANARFLGMVLLAKLQAAAMGRVRMPVHARRDFHVYVDEFQSLATQSFVTMLSEARKFGLSLVLANQFVSQIKDSRIVESIFGNVGTLVCFRLGQTDAEVLAREMFPTVTRSDFISLPNWQAYVTTLLNGQFVEPFNIQTVPVEGAADEARASRIVAQARARYARPRVDAEADVAASFEQA